MRMGAMESLKACNGPKSKVENFYEAKVIFILPDVIQRDFNWTRHNHYTKMSYQSLSVLQEHKSLLDQTGTCMHKGQNTLVTEVTQYKHGTSTTKWDLYYLISSMGDCM